MNEKTVKRVLSKKKYGSPAPANIVIPYRYEQGRTMHATFFDHYTIRNCSRHPTVISMPPIQAQMDDRLSKLQEFIDHNTALTLDLGVDNKKSFLQYAKIH